MGKTSTSYKKGHKNPGPGRPPKAENAAKKCLVQLMAIAEVRYLTQAEIDQAMTSAVTLMNSDFNYFKFLIERQEREAEAQRSKLSLPKLKTIGDISEIAVKIAGQMLEEKIPVKKAKEITEVLKNISELNLAPEIERLEDMTGKE